MQLNQGANRSLYWFGSLIILKCYWDVNHILGDAFVHLENLYQIYLLITSRWPVLCRINEHLDTFWNGYGFEIRNCDAARVLNDRGQQELRSQAGKLGIFLMRQTQECQNPK